MAATPGPVMPMLALMYHGPADMMFQDERLEGRKGVEGYENQTISICMQSSQVLCELYDESVSLFLPG